MAEIYNSFLLQDQFVKSGGVIRDNCPVTEVVAGPDGVKIHTNKGCVVAKKVVMTVGPWAQVWMEKLCITNRIVVRRPVPNLITVASANTETSFELHWHKKVTLTAMRGGN